MDITHFECAHLTQLIARRNLTNVFLFFHSDFAPPQMLPAPVKIIQLAWKKSNAQVSMCGSLSSII